SLSLTSTEIRAPPSVRLPSRVHLPCRAATLDTLELDCMSEAPKGCPPTFQGDLHLWPLLMPFMLVKFLTRVATPPSKSKCCCRVGHWGAPLLHLAPPRVNLML